MYLGLAGQVDTDLVVPIPLDHCILAAPGGGFLLRRAEEGSSQPDHQCGDPDSEQCRLSHRTVLHLSVDTMARRAGGTSDGVAIFLAAAVRVKEVLPKRHQLTGVRESPSAGLNPNPESTAAPAMGQPFSDFGLRTSFELRVSVFGFQGCGLRFGFHPPDLRAALPHPVPPAVFSMNRFRHSARDSLPRELAESDSTNHHWRGTCQAGSRASRNCFSSSALDRRAWRRHRRQSLRCGPRHRWAHRTQGIPGRRRAAPAPARCWQATLFGPPH